ncbi:hypothetical protein MTR67_007496 [Solanum verrucosum]|uniref:Reverse transcriptase domain-containing protein n=1 Tax=Solanum verrucosum TaxID=315347 RepID=A0AAF0Q581_SOLVR|nr:hypothetical protein MTR67_007496 [Solanum verrucosum]
MPDQNLPYKLKWRRALDKLYSAIKFASIRADCGSGIGRITKNLLIRYFNEIKQISLIRLASDHNPILLTCGNWDWKKTYFKFETWWLEVDGFKDKVKELWESFRVKGRPGYVLAKKFKMLKATIKEWSKYNRGNWKQKKDDILNQISYQETVREQRPLTDDELVQKANLTLEFEERAFEEKEIVECLTMCAVDKASGPDGFPMNEEWELGKWGSGANGEVDRILYQTIRFSVLVNGEPVGFFASERGSRQGDSISPFLFILAMEGFDSMMRIAAQNKWISDFRIGGSVGEEMEISRLLYADYTIIFCEPVAKLISYIGVILVLFEAVAGLKFNGEKQCIPPSK